MCRVDIHSFQNDSYVRSAHLRAVFVARARVFFGSGQRSGLGRNAQRIARWVKYNRYLRGLAGPRGAPRAGSKQSTSAAG